MEFEGVGVHTGTQVRIRLGGAPENSGISFRRVDLPHCPCVPARLDFVVDTDLGTTLGLGDLRVQTVEHVMAALAATRIDNAQIDLDGPEPPILDGSFKMYTEALFAVAEIQKEEASFFTFPGPFRLNHGGGTTYETFPDTDFRISAAIHFDHALIGHQQGHFRIDTDFRKEISPARTFGFKADAETLRRRGLALGASLENTLVLDQDGLVNDGLHFPDEFLRHKVGDLVGDLALLGERLRGMVIAKKPSHTGNISLARALESRASSTQELVMDIQKLMEFLPHRYPMLLVDRILDFESEKRIVGLKNVTVNEPFFQGHFPGHPVMPGVLLIEAMAQAAGLLIMESVENPDKKVTYLMGVDRAKFRQPVVPGDQVIFHIEVTRFKPSLCRMWGVGKVDGKTVVEAELKARVMDR